MDDDAKKKFSEDMDSFENAIRESTMDTGVKNGFIETISLMKRMHIDTQMAHLRIDHRKGELKKMQDNIEKLTSSVDKMSKRISDLITAQRGFVEIFHEQFENNRKQAKRVTAYVTAISVISLIGTFGSLKGASIASSIWNVIGKLL